MAGADADADGFSRGEGQGGDWVGFAVLCFRDNDGCAVDGKYQAVTSRDWRVGIKE